VAPQPVPSAPARRSSSGGWRARRRARSTWRDSLTKACASSWLAAARVRGGRGCRRRRGSGAAGQEGGAWLPAQASSGRAAARAAAAAAALQLRLPCRRRIMPEHQPPSARAETRPPAAVSSLIANPPHATPHPHVTPPPHHPHHPPPVSGILKGYDQLLNVVLDDAVEYLRGAGQPREGQRGKAGAAWGNRAACGAPGAWGPGRRTRPAAHGSPAALRKWRSTSLPWRADGPGLVSQTRAQPVWNAGLSLAPRLRHPSLAFVALSPPSPTPLDPEDPMRVTDQTRTLGLVVGC
jgi:hypothetical protein